MPGNERRPRLHDEVEGAEWMLFDDTATSTGLTWQVALNADPISSCECHPGQWAIDCLECGNRALAFRSRARVDRAWNRDTSGWSCACGAHGGLWQLRAATA